MKKVKLINNLPPVQNGVHSASRTPTVDEGRIIDIKTEGTDELVAESLGKFFDDANITDEESFPDYKISDSVKKMLRSTKVSENNLRNAIFTDLYDNLGVSFLESSWQDSYDDQGSKQYSEQVLNTLLELLGTKMGHEGIMQMRKIMRRLPVTTSMPDLAPLSTRDGKLGIWMGELKNGDYEEHQARTQCLMYLLGLLYWLRTVLGLPVESVRGFYVCGCKCKDNDNEMYTVGLLKLDAPQFLGDTAKAYYLSTEDVAENGYFPLTMLYHFLTRGKCWTLSQRDPAKDKIPCLSVLPTCLWNSDNQDRTLVVHFSLSIVFRINGRGIKKFLGGESRHFKDFKTNQAIPAYENFLKELFGLLIDDTWYYLKIRTRDSSSQTNPMCAMFDAWYVITGNNDLHEFKKTYLLRPLAVTAFGVAVMHDRGRRLADVPSFTMTALGEFAKIKDAAMFLGKHLPHGDVLPHNIVWDDKQQKMTLIDIDEGVSKGGENYIDHILQRKNQYFGNSGDWYIAISYPNPLRSYADLYTQTQLIASFLYLMKSVSNPRSCDLLQYENLHKTAVELGGILVDLDKKDKKVKKRNKQQLKMMVNSAYDIMVDMINCA